MSSPDLIKICFVCMGNICRSPLAECVFRHKARERGLLHRFEIDSAGTGGWHAGEPPDPRVCQCATKHKVTMTGTARQIRCEDFKAFDLLICMDEDNRDHVLAMGASPEKVKLLLEYDPKSPRREVPDPYYGGEDGFELVYQLVDQACEAMLKKLLERDH